MGNKKTANRVAPKVSSSTALSAAASTHKTNSSSILRSAFSPSRFQLSLFATVIQALDSHQLRIHDTVSGRLTCEYSLVRAKISSLDWGYYGSDPRSVDERPLKKKKRKIEDTNGAGRKRADVVVAFGTNESEIHLFSPAEAKVLVTLKGGHTDGISDFKFKDYGLGSEAWSIGNDKKLVQWSLQDATILRSIAVAASPSLPLSVVLPLNSSVLVASNIAYRVDLHGPGQAVEVVKGISNIHTLLADAAPSHHEDPEKILAASVAERYLNVHSLKTGTLIGSLVAGGDVESIAVSGFGEKDGENDANVHKVLAAVTKNGEVELFTSPFTFETKATDGASLKSILKQKSRQHSAKVKITRPDQQSKTVPLVATTFQQSELVIAYQEGSGLLGFERILWLDKDDKGLALSGTVVLTKAKTLLGLAKDTMNGVKDMGRTHVDESKVVVSHANGIETDAMAIDRPEVIDISSAEEEEIDSEADDELEAEISNQPSHALSDRLVNGSKKADVDMRDASPADDQDCLEDAAQDDEKDEVEAEPTFGELLRANARGTIDVSSAFPDQQEQGVVPYAKGSAKLPSGMSLGTVLSQSLRTNDTSLLETCFHEQDLHVVRATIERLDSTLATLLLQKLAERLHSRPGRAGSLMVWIQWTLVAHGGHLGAQPDVVKKLAALHRIVKERANSLQPLLALKGKLDMLEAQMNLRRSMNSRYGIGDAVHDQENEGVVYVEGQEDSDSSGEDEPAGDTSNLHSALRDSEEESSAADEDMHDAMGTEEADEGEEDESSDESAEGLIDDEASETDDDEGDDGAVDYDDVDSVGDDSEGENDDEEEVARSRTANGKAPLTNGISSRKAKAK